MEAFVGVICGMGLFLGYVIMMAAWKQHLEDKRDDEIGI